MSSNDARRAGSAGAPEISRALRLLARRGARSLGSEVEVTSADGGGGRYLPANVWSHLLRNRWVERDGADGRWRLSQHGRAELKRKMSMMPEDDAAGLRMGIRRPKPDKPGFDAAECPVGWLARRRDKNGEPMISPEQLAAAERLRADFWFAGMTPKVTTNWTAALGAGRGQRSPAGAGVDIQDAVIAAGMRVRQALAAVGPEHSGLLVDVCCHLKGLEQVERGLSWPPRTAKVVLGIALNQLARHYGLTPSRPNAETCRARVRHWGAEGYRPSVDGAASEEGLRGGAGEGGAGVGTDALDHGGEAV